MIYLVIYDLYKAGQNYDGLISAIEKFPHIQCQQSAWFINTNNSAGTLFNHLLPYIDSNDKLFVTKVTQDFASRLNQEVNGWLRANLL